MNHELTEKTLLAFMQDSGPVGKNDIAAAFGIKGDVRIALKDILRDLEQSGQIIKVGGQRYTVPVGLPDVCPLRITTVTLDGELFAEPVEWDTDARGPRPKVMVEADAKDHATLNEGDMILARIRKDSPSGLARGPQDESDTGPSASAEGQGYVAKIIRRIDAETTTIIGEIIKTKSGFGIRTLQKRGADHYDIQADDLNGATPNDLVSATISAARGAVAPVAKVISVIGKSGDPRAMSLVAAHELGLRTEFPAHVIKEAEDLPRPTMGPDRQDLRKIPLVTIDGEDARDFDDAVFAEPDNSGENPGGYHLIVAIADVSHYVRAGTALDTEAYKRGNSTYFPDRVLPMLPEGLSNDLCSLRPKEDRYCLAVHMWIDKNGVMINHKFVRGLMKSMARLTYTQVQAAYNGNTDATTDPLLRPIIFPLYEAYKLLQKARLARGTLELEMPERKILVDDTGAMSGVALRERFDSHKMIEEFMVLANVAAALALQKKKAPCVYRVHDSPSFEKVQNLRTYLSTFGIDVPKGDVTEPDQLAQILRKSKGKPFAQLVSESMLRSQMQAHYSTDNIGHFGLALNHYAHFTSPIRRYADLLVHRSLIRAYGFGDGGLDDETRVKLPAMCEHISITERASMEAERNTVDRFTAHFLADQVGATFDATISSVTRFGLFVRLADSGADGLIPMRMMDGDFFVHDERLHALVGRRTGAVYRLGAPIRVELIEAAPLAGALMFRVAGETLGADIPGYELNIDPDTYRPPMNDRDGPRGGFRGGPRGGGGRSDRSGGGRDGKGRDGPRSRVDKGRHSDARNKGKPKRR
jgi:ribonuclease R